MIGEGGERQGAVLLARDEVAGTSIFLWSPAEFWACSAALSCYITGAHYRPSPILPVPLATVIVPCSSIEFPKDYSVVVCT